MPLKDNHCTRCPFGKKCSANKKDIPTIITDSKGLAISAMAQKMAASTAKEIYRKRKTIVEPVYGHIKTGGFTRFRLRGLAGASGEFALICAVSNLKKIIKKIKNSGLNVENHATLVQVVS